jgi:HlyD family secretion protein
VSTTKWLVPKSCIASSTTWVRERANDVNNVNLGDSVEVEVDAYTSETKFTVWSPTLPYGEDALTAKRVTEFECAFACLPKFSQHLQRTVQATQ